MSSVRISAAILILLGLAAMSPGARTSRLARCHRACAVALRACGSTTRRRSDCRHTVLHRCRTGGAQACEGAAPLALDGGAASVIADDFVKSNDPGHNFGRSTILVVAGGTLKYAVLRVSVAGVGPDRTVDGAVIRLQVADASGSDSPSGGAVHLADCAGWTETTLTWASRPSFGPALGPPAGPVQLGQTVDFDIGGAITGDGDYCFVWDSPSTDQVVYNAREATAGGPLVLLTVSGGPPATSTTTTSSTASTAPAATTTSTSDPATTIATTTSSTTSTSSSTPPPPLPSTLELEPVADTYVNAGSKAAFGSSKVLLADASPVCIGYLRFVVAGVGGRAVDRAVLRLQVDAASSAASKSGGSVHQISDHAWLEAKVTWKLRPAVDGPVLSTLGAVKAKQLVDFDLKGTVTGDGTYDLAIDSTSSDSVSYRSREAATGRPRLVLTLGQPTTTSTATTTTTSTTLPGAPPHLKTVFILMLENHDWASFKDSPEAPYINGTLLPAFAHAESYLSGGVFPSLPNYIALEAGNDFGLLGQSPLPTAFRIGTPTHLTTQLNGMGVSWKSYSEDLPGAGTVCNTTAESTIYSLDHDTFAYFDDVTGNPPDPNNAYCIEHIRPYTELAADLQSGAVARYNFIIPNDQDQGEKHTTPGSSLVAQADAWVAREVPAILASSAWQDGGVLLILWDEGRTHGANVPIGCIVVSPFAKPGYANTIPYSHASTLRTVQEIFGATPLLGKAADATDLSDLFTVFP